MLVAILINDETWIVCGGRNFSDKEMFDSAMSDLMNERGGMPSTIVQGGARGADTLAKEWAERYALISITEKAKWDVHGRSAGPIRNQIMLDKYKPDLVVAFPGGKGTADMVERSRKVNTDIAEILEK